MIYKLYLIRPGGGYAGGPIARPSQSTEPVGRLRKVLCSCQRGRCRWSSASCPMELCQRQVQRRCRGSGRTERQPGPWFPGLRCRPAAGPCTYERRYGGEQREVTTRQLHRKLCNRRRLKKKPHKSRAWCQRSSLTANCKHELDRALISPRGWLTRDRRCSRKLLHGDITLHSSAAHGIGP